MKTSEVAQKENEVVKEVRLNALEKAYIPENSSKSFVLKKTSGSAKIMIKGKR
ncbi:hypothetical protein Q0590_24985 [Rhodocytophaga aerolata]|uniref:Uncharacterized protein n=1 Tax=Rhodocytophaga aerolata TaxID=455078 RepID=A0ABT8RBT0_9BACT|nr:hypothetical protein [Rhodocytophaga aerolata]MDO1449556.1 hypothetical protein [Rhodocytophaga aerolata]